MIHADNCNLLGDNICEKKSPAFYWRDYSAILYLNEDFEGGQFIFSSDSKGKKIQVIDFIGSILIRIFVVIDLFLEYHQSAMWKNGSIFIRK